MKGLNKLVLASAIAAISAGAQAELKALDDSAMGELTGQAGLTIDIETQYTIGEFAYKDGTGAAGGSVLFQDIQLQGGLYGGGTGLVDNIRLKLDVAAAGEVLDYGLSEITTLAAYAVSEGNADTTVKAIGAGAANLNTAKTYNDGDLVIHFDATDHLKAAGGFATVAAGEGLTTAEYYGNEVLGAGITGTRGIADYTFDEIKAVIHTAVDFNFSIGAIKIASSDYVMGSGAAAGPVPSAHDGVEDFDAAGNSTTLISDLSIQGFLGQVDISIENNGNEFGSYETGSFVADTYGDASSKIHWDRYIDITDLDVYIDIAGVKIENMKINNTRGATTDVNYKESFGFAHSTQDIYAVSNSVLLIDTATALTGDAALDRTNHYVDGIAINTKFSGDQEIGALSFGDTGTSIGELYWTDIRSTTNMTISAH